MIKIFLRAVLTVVGTTSLLFSQIPFDDKEEYLYRLDIEVNKDGNVITHHVYGTLHQRRALPQYPENYFLPAKQSENRYVESKMDFHASYTPQRLDSKTRKELKKLIEQFPDLKNQPITKNQYGKTFTLYKMIDEKFLFQPEKNQKPTFYYYRPEKIAINVQSYLINKGIFQTEAVNTSPAKIEFGEESQFGKILGSQSFKPLESNQNYIQKMDYHRETWIQYTKDLMAAAIQAYDKKSNSFTPYARNSEVYKNLMKTKAPLIESMQAKDDYYPQTIENIILQSEGTSSILVGAGHLEKIEEHLKKKYDTQTKRWRITDQQEEKWDDDHWSGIDPPSGGNGGPGTNSSGDKELGGVSVDIKLNQTQPTQHQQDSLVNLKKAILHQIEK